MSNLVDESLLQLVEVMPNPALLSNPSGIVHYVNCASVAHFFGQQSQAMTGRSLDDVFSSLTCEWQRRREEVMATGRVQTWDIPDGNAEPRPAWIADLVPWPDH